MDSGVRLSVIEQNAIKEAVSGLDPKARVILFGSRVDDSKRGGDIDLLIMSEQLSNRNKEPIRTSICQKIGWQKIDIVIAKDDSSPFVKIALETGVLL